jgi:hypothetical protein
VISAKMSHWEAVGRTVLHPTSLFFAELDGIMEFGTPFHDEVASPVQRSTAGNRYQAS